jgi:hypothetical protein
MTYAWDRLMVDPLPGPRTLTDFVGLRRLAPHVHEVLGATTVRAPAGSSLPRLAADLGARLLLLDPTTGAAGIAEQITAAADHFRLDDVVLVDVGGDAITDGHDPGLRSPLADQLALAGVLRAGLPARLLVTGAGLDGEVPADVVRARFATLTSALEHPPALGPADVAAVRHVFDWHPSEASGLLTAAASGHRGLVEVRDAGDQVELSDEVTRIYVADAHQAAELTPAPSLVDTTTLDEAERCIAAATGISEIRYETEKAARIRDRHPRMPTMADLPDIDQHAVAAHHRGAHYISLRRLAELLGASTPDSYTAMTALLAQARPAHYSPSIYRVTPADRPAVAVT